MDPGLKVSVTAGTLAAMTDEQFRSLRSVLGEGSWETTRNLRISSGGDFIGVHISNRADGDNVYFLGIEKDGYTHS